MTESRLNPNSPFFHEERHAPLAAVADRPLTICGAGALGGTLAETVARMGFGRLTQVLQLDVSCDVSEREPGA